MRKKIINNQQDKISRKYVHPTAEISEDVIIGKNTKIWHQTQIREDVKIGDNCTIGKGVYVDFGVVIGSNVKIQNGSNIYNKTVLEDGVFLGPGVLLLNDKYPRSINKDKKLKRATDWSAGKILVKEGASIGAGTIIMPNITIGRYAMIGAGSIVTKDVTDYGLVIGCPARLIGFVCECGMSLKEKKLTNRNIILYCKICKKKLISPKL